jgi:hypothetical protein
MRNPPDYSVYFHGGIEFARMARVAINLMVSFAADCSIAPMNRNGGLPKAEALK